MPRKKNAAATTKPAASARRRSTRRTTTAVPEIPNLDIYNEMLEEAYHDNPADFEQSPRPVKRRKVTPQPAASSSGTTREVLDRQPGGLQDPTESLPEVAVQQASAATTSSSNNALSPKKPVAQTAYQHDFSDSDADSDDFEDVDIDPHASTEEENSSIPTEDLKIDLGAVATPRKPVPRRKPVTKAERQFRLDVHKWHLLCGIVHVATRNKWCDDEKVQKTLKSLVGKKLISRLHREGTQAERKFSFDQAIEELCGIWKATFNVTERGMRRAYWREELDMEKEMEEAGNFIDFEDFQHAARDCSGSRDLGAQLFCALLRSVAVDTRLVCSLQVLPFSRVAKVETPQKTAPAYIQATRQDFGTSRRGVSKKSIVDSAFPIWWVEVFNPAVDQWLPLDPLVRGSINKPRTGFEPPASDSLNSMSYVIAFEDDGSAKDVTQRYVSAFNAKTRKLRVESTKNGEEWFTGVMKHFSKPLEPRDEIEDAALSRRLAQEGMPKNVQDFKDHPVYVLERHLRVNEVLEPRKECGKFSVGTGKNQKVEPVFRRQAVHSCRSADGWYRRGRDVRPGEQPLKRVMKRRGMTPDEEEDEGVALYAEFQTDVYIPPPVVDGKVPKNGFGNLDVYVPGMIPAGGVHLKHSLAMQAAKVLGIHAVEAVVGFKFKGRQGTAVIDGVVVAAEYTAAMLSTISAVEDQLEEEVEDQRSAILGGVWKKMIEVLRVRSRLQEEYGGLEDKETADSGALDDPDYEDEAGGFVAEAVGEPTADSRAEETANLISLKNKQPIALPSAVIRQQVIVVRSPHALSLGAAVTDDDLFGSDDGAGAGGFFPGNDQTPGPGGYVTDVDSGGGFIVEDAQASGFVQDEDPASERSTSNADDGLGGGFLTADDEQGKQEVIHDDSFPRALAPQTINQSLPQRRTSPHDPANIQEDKLAKPSPTEADYRFQKNGDSLPSTQTSKASKSKRKGKQRASASDSETSLPSHDPDEDGLEMQWLEDAFDDD